jgi:hypothetical protein
LTDIEEVFRVPVQIVDVPGEAEKVPGYCVVTCTYMLLRYYEKRGLLSKALPKYDDFKGQFGQYIGTLGLPPNKLRDYLNKAVPNESLRVQHKTGKIQSLEYHLRNKTPVIPIFDYLMYQQGTAAKATHATLLTGYTAENFYANNPIHGKRYPYEKPRFEQAWLQRDNKYILITPKEATLNSYLTQSSGC